MAEAVRGNEGACSTPLFCDAPSIRAALRPIYQAQGQVRANWRQGPKYANKAPPQHHPSDRHVPCRAPATFIFGTVVDSQAVAHARAAARLCVWRKIGRASCRDRLVPESKISVVAEHLKK